MRTIAIGDIHGCCKALLGLLEAIQPSRDDRLIFLGDYVDRGPDSKGVIDTLRALKTECETVFLLGNHELMFRGALFGLDPTLWLQLGGRATLHSYGGTLDRVHRDHFEFLNSCLPSYETENHIFVHANYVPNLPLDQQPEIALFWEHLSDRFPMPHMSGKTAFCGHSPQTNGQIANFGHLICIDTFCFGGAWLSAMDVSTGENWQVNREGHLRRHSPFWQMIRSLLRKPRENRMGQPPQS